MNRQKTHAYFNAPTPSNPTHSLPLSHLNPHNSRSSSTLRPALRQSTLNQSHHSNSSVHQKSLTRSGIYLTTDSKRTKKDKEISKLYQQLHLSRMKIKQLQQKQIQNFVLKKENQMFRLQLEKIKEEIKIYTLQQQEKQSYSAADTGRVLELNNKFQVLSQHNMENLKMISDLKIELNNCMHENRKLRKEIVEQEVVMERVKAMEGMCRKLEIEMESEGRQWEIQKKTFIEILHAEIEQGKKKGW